MNLLRILTVMVVCSDLVAAQTTKELHQMRQELGHTENDCLQVPDLSLFPPSDSASWVWRDKLVRPTAQGIAVHLLISAVGRSTWSLRITNPNGYAESVDSSSIDSTPWARWLPVVPGTTVQFEIAGDPTGLSMKVDHCVPIIPKPRVQNIISNTMKPIDAYQTETFYPWAKTVARLQITEPAGIYACTAFLVGADLLLTAGHCLGKDAWPIQAQFEIDATGRSAQAGEYDVKKVEASSLTPDYALLRLAKRVADSYPIATLDNRADLNSGLPLLIIHYPGGDVEMISRDQCTATQIIAAANIQHNCDTESGSSGAPVFFPTGGIAGVHRAGFAEGLKGGLNWATTIPAILADIGKQNPGVLPDIHVYN